MFLTLHQVTHVVNVGQPCAMELLTSVQYRGYQFDVTLYLFFCIITGYLREGARQEWVTSCRTLLKIRNLSGLVVVLFITQ